MTEAEQESFSLPCMFRGEPTGETVECGCSLKERPAFYCKHELVELDKCLIRIGGRARQKLKNKLFAECSACEHRMTGTAVEAARKKQRAEPPADTPRAPIGVRPGDVYRTEQKRQMELAAQESVIVPGQEIVVDCNKHGYGDAVTMAWIAEGSKNGPVYCRLHATGSRKVLLKALGQEVVQATDDMKTTFLAYSHELGQRGAGSRVIQRGRFLGIPTMPVRPTCTIPHRDTEWAKQAIPDKTVLLFPNTMHGAREWPTMYWIELYHQLQRVGLNPLVMMGKRDGRYDGMNSLSALPWPKTMAAMLQSYMVVGNDSGPMHVAGTLDVKTVALLGPTTSAVHNWMPSVVGLSALPTDIDCVGCYFHAPHREHCEWGCVALSHLLPERVLEVVLGHL